MVAVGASVVHRAATVSTEREAIDMTTATKAQDELAKLLKQDTELHSKIAKAANGITEAVVRESLTAALGADTAQTPA